MDQKQCDWIEKVIANAIAKGEDNTPEIQQIVLRLCELLNKESRGKLIAELFDTL